MTRNEKIKFLIIRTLGNFLLLFSLFGVIMTFGPAVFYEVQFRTIQARGIQYEVSNDGKLTEVGNETPADSEPVDGPTFGDVLTGETKQYLQAKDTKFSILIPKLAANARIYPNVDPGNDAIFKPVLMKGIAHAKGSVFPGMPGNTYLFAHSTDNWWNVGRYNAVFYLLKELTPGDEIVVFFEHQRHDYVVDSTEIKGPDDTEYLKHAQEGPERLVLQTCWPPGTTWKRLYVVAVPK
jgi:LPXTG-site transpeptidase (sortase) family protein